MGSGKSKPKRSKSKDVQKEDKSTQKRSSKRKKKEKKEKKEKKKKEKKEKSKKGESSDEGMINNEPFNYFVTTFVAFSELLSILVKFWLKKQKEKKWLTLLYGLASPWSLKGWGKGR